jgi:hypothetical protein
VYGLNDTAPEKRAPATLSETNNAKWLEILASFRPNVVYVQGRMDLADILSRPPHQPLPALPDFGQSIGGTSIPVPLALLLNQPGAGLGCSSGLAPISQSLTVSGSLYMLGDGHLGIGGLPVPRCTKGLYSSLLESSQPTNVCRPIWNDDKPYHCLLQTTLSHYMSFRCPTVYKNCATILMGTGLQFTRDPSLQDPHEFFNTYQVANDTTSGIEIFIIVVPTSLLRQQVLGPLC